MSVLVWHHIVAFFPERSGIFPGQDLTKAFISRFWFGLIYGTSAVAFFFVLSGFVLTRRYFMSGDASQIHRNAVKRWPRLVVPVLATVLSSWALLRLDLYRHQPAAVITQSWWLWYFGYASAQPISPDFVYALQHGTFLTFLHGDFLYDSSLWTMRYEFIGSFIAMGLALFVRPMRGNAVKLYLIYVVVAVCNYADPQYVAFPVGMAVAAFLPEGKTYGSRPLVAIAVVLSVYLLGYSGLAVGAFRPLAWILPRSVPVVYVSVTGSVLLIVAAKGSPWLHSALSGRWGTFLGRLSFPLYLVHVPVICSVGSAVLVNIAPRLGPTRGVFVATAISMAASVIAAYPLMVLNERWLVVLNGMVARFLPRAAHQPAE